MTSPPPLALGASVLALTVALAGGGGYALARGAHLPKNSVTSKTVKNDSLTGKDIKESTLGLVPQAQSAQAAVVAAGVSGYSVSRIDLTTGLEHQPLYRGHGLRIEAGCGFDDPSLGAFSDVDGAGVYASLVDLDQHVVHSNYLAFPTFGTAGNGFDLLVGASNPEAEPSLTTFTYNGPDGSVVTGTIGLHVAASGTCQFTGTVTAS